MQSIDKMITDCMRRAFHEKNVLKYAILILSFLFLFTRKD